MEDFPQLPVLLIISTFNFRELKCFELGVANVGAWYLLGVACLSLGEAQSALDALKRAHVYATNDAAITENLAVAHLAAGEASVAEALLSHLIARGATSGLLHMRHGLALPCNNWGGCLKRNRRCVWRCKPRPVKPMFM